LTTSKISLGWQSRALQSLSMISRLTGLPLANFETAVVERPANGYIMKKWRLFMESMIIDREILPEPISSYIRSKKIKISEENGNIILTPVKHKPNVNDLFGMFNDGKLSSDDFIKQKAVEREMEN
jgi:hypothetical protein